MAVTKAVDKSTNGRQESPVVTPSRPTNKECARKSLEQAGLIGHSWTNTLPFRTTHIHIFPISSSRIILSLQHENDVSVPLLNSVLNVIIFNGVSGRTF